MNHKNYKITRRGFNISLMTTVIASAIPVKATTLQNKADGLLQIDKDGCLKIYSGVGCSSPYSDEDSVATVLEVLNNNFKSHRVMVGQNPDQLPCILAQHQNHLSFTNKNTNQAAAKLLKSLTGSTGPSFYVEDGVSDETREMANSLKGDGVVVAVRERI